MQQKNNSVFFFIFLRYENMVGVYFLTVVWSTMILISIFKYLLNTSSFFLLFIFRYIKSQ
jgi:hypothetical protein